MTTSSQGDSLTLSQRVLLALKETRAKLEAYERARSEPIAIVGMGCRFPGGADNPDLFWDLLCRGVNAVREVPAERWDVDAYYDPDPDTPGKTPIRNGGFLPQVDLFDAHFFGISPREASSMDPQQRLLLEVAWEAFEHAGQGRDHLFGNQVGVFIGIGNVDYARLMHDSARTDSIDLYATTGNVFSAAAGRLSYTLGLHGPSVSLDTACSSSLVAIHLACQSLRTDESVVALAGGVNLILAPETMIAMSRVPGGLSPDGKCKAFDESANGLARGEGCGLVVLKRLSDAVRDRDNILALIRGSAVNQDGRSAGLTVPNGQAQVALIEKALSTARVDPADVAYLEAHGPGTALGDPIEAGALGAVFGRARSRTRPLIVGSVKTNIGHLESAAGVAGLIKTALVLRHGEAPPNLHFEKPNPHIAWDRIPMSVPTERTALAPVHHSRIAAVSAFGVAGTNAHAVLEEPPAREPRGVSENPFRDAHGYLLTLSARSEPALQQLLGRYAEHLERQPNLPVTDVVYTASAGRFHFPHRIAVLADSVAGMRDQLQRACAGESSAGVVRGQSSAPPNIAFVFTDEPPNDATVGQRLEERFPVFRGALEECDRLFRQKTGRSLRAVLYPAPAEARPVSPEDGHAVTFSLGYALAELWRSWAVLPSVVMGSGAGEIAAACAAGIATVDQAMDLSLAGGRLKYAHSGSVTLDNNLEQIVSATTFSTPGIPIVSQVTGRRVSDEMESARYWAASFAAAPPSFAASLQSENVQISLSIGPGAPPEILERLATLYVMGATINWESFYRDVPCRRTVLPTYPFQRQRYWFEKKEIARPEPDRFAPDPTARHLYQEEWRPQAASGAPRPESGPPGTWLILADVSGIGAQIAVELRARGNTCVVLVPGTTGGNLEGGAMHLDPGSPEDCERLIAHLGEHGMPPLAGIVHLWAIDSPSGEAELNEVNRALSTQCGSALHLVQAVMKTRHETVPKIWFGTRGAVQVDEKEPASPAPFSLWGMARVLANEHPELGCTRIDLDPKDSSRAAAQLLSEVLVSSGEKEVAFRGGQRFVSRLARLPQPAIVPRPALALRPDATYLITGGLGGLGRLLARWLIGKGAAHVALLGRTAPQPGVHAELEALRQTGATITVLQADVSVPDQLEGALAHIAAGPPLRGVVHCSAVLDDGIVINQSWERFERVLRPKVGGAWNLHALTRNADLDFFVLFSSASSVFGNPGQANYAAGNAFLDALARARRAQGLTALSVNWGIWSGAGGVAEKQLERTIDATGVGTIRPEDGLDALEQLLLQSAPQVAMIPIHWPEFLDRTGSWTFLDEFRRASPPKVEITPPFVETLMAAPAGDRRSLLRTHIGAQVEQVLRTNTSASFSSRQGFFEMGMDSLTAVELKNRVQTSLGCRLPSTVAFECPTIDALVDYLAKEHLASLFVDDQVIAADAPSAESEPEDPTDRLSEEDVNRLVDEKLQAIETLLER